MKTAIKILVLGPLCGLLFCLPAYAQKTKAQLNTEITTTFPDNTVGAITPAGLRSVTADLANSIMPTAPVVAGNLACFNGITGLLQDCGSAPTTVPLTIGTTPISSGTNLRVIYDNAGILGEYSNTQLTALISPATTSLSGALPPWPNNATTFFRGDGTYATLNVGAIGGFGTGVGAALGVAVNASGGIVSPTPTRAGDILYWNGTAWVTLAGNNSGTQLLQENASGLPSWVTVSGTGTVTSITCFGTAITSSGICATAATKSDEQTGTSTTAVVTPSQQQSHDSAAKAWAYFTTTGSNGAQTLNQAYNISAITRNALGSYSATFSPTPFASSTSFGCAVTAYVSAVDIFGEAGSSGISTTNINFFFRTVTSGSPAAADPPSGFIECLGRQ